MEPLILRVAERFAGTVRLDLAWVESLRKDFLTLLKNLPKIKDYQTAHKVRDALRIYRKRFDELFFEHFLNKDLQYNHDLGLTEGDAKYVDKKLRSDAWSFSSELSSMPIGFVDGYNSEATLFQRFEQNAPAWKARLQRKAQDFWRAMKEVIEWIEGRLKKNIDVKVPTVENATIEGFKFVMRGYDPENDYNVKELIVLKEGLRLYRQRASKVAPILMQKQLPVIAEFKATLDKGGEYNGNGTITFYMSSIVNKGPAWVAHVMAHEMGHHLWKSVLSGDAQKFWTQTIRGDFGDLDIQEVLNKWPGDAWAFNFSGALGKEDPVLSLQMESLSLDSQYSKVQSKEDFQRLLDSGVRTLKVPKTPITGYANKNPEEAFCETLGLLVAYGPRAVDDKVKFWLETALPGAVRLASVEDVVVGRFESAATK
jgi:hypothetical protein